MSTAIAVAPRVRARTQHPLRLAIVGIVIVGALVFVIIRGLGNATLYFRTADEAVAQRAQLGQRRFRIEGVVVAGSIQANGIFTDFSIAGNGVTVPVHNDGQPLGIFQENIPVVLEGHFGPPGAGVFESDRILVKHSATYVAKHPDRVGLTSATTQP